MRLRRHGRGRPGARPHDPGTPPRAPRGPAVPVVATNHGPFTEETRRIYAVATRALTSSPSSEGHAASAGPDVDVAAVIPHGIDLDAYPMGAGDGDYVLFLGRMSPTKGAHLAIDAAQRAGVPIRLAAKCREEAEQRYFDEYIRPRLAPGVDYLGEVVGDDKVALIGGAQQALVNPIQWDEPFGLVMVEALACGTPVIATPRGTARDIIDDGVTGWACRRRRRHGDGAEACRRDRSPDLP